MYILLNISTFNGILMAQLYQRNERSRDCSSERCNYAMINRHDLARQQGVQYLRNRETVPLYVSTISYSHRFLIFCEFSILRQYVSKKRTSQLTPNLHFCPSNFPNNFENIKYFSLIVDQFSYLFSFLSEEYSYHHISNFFDMMCIKKLQYIFNQTITISLNVCLFQLINETMSLVNIK